MKYLNLEESKIKDTVKGLNQLLADYHLFYQKLRNFHWNIVGPHFFTLHEKFEEMYDDAKVKIDEIAERILTLGYQPESNFSTYLKTSNVKEAASDLSDVEMVKNILKDQGKLNQQLNAVIGLAEDAGDEGTMDLLTPYIEHMEKDGWMLRSWTMGTNDTHKTL